MSAVQVVIAKTPEQFQAAGRLLHDEYVKEGIILTTDDGSHQSEHARHGPKNASSTFLGLLEGNYVATVTAFLDGSKYGLPANKLYASELNAMGLRGEKIVEVGELGRKRENIRELRDLLGYAFNFALHTEATQIIGQVLPKHGDIYCKAAGFKRVGDEKRIFNDRAVVLIAMDVDGNSRWQDWWRRHPLSASEVLRTQESQ